MVIYYNTETILYKCLPYVWVFVFKSSLCDIDKKQGLPMTTP